LAFGPGDSLVSGGGFGRLIIVRRKRNDEQPSEEDQHRKSAGSQKNFESLRVHKPAQLTRIRLVFSVSGVKRQRQAGEKLPVITASE